MLAVSASESSCSCVHVDDATATAQLHHYVKTAKDLIHLVSNTMATHTDIHLDLLNPVKEWV